MKYLFAGCFIVIFSTASFTIWVDPGHRWHRQALDISTHWPEEHVFISYAALEERRFRTQHIKALRKDPELIVFGSSRSFVIEQKMININMFNASVSGGTVFDMIWAWQSFVERKSTPKFVVIYADTWLFNKNTWAKYRWVKNADIVKRFLDENLTSEDDFLCLSHLDICLKYYFSLVAGMAYEFTEPINLSTVKQSIIDARRMLSGKIDEQMIIPEQQRPKERNAWRYDGSYIHANSKTIRLSLEKITAISKNVGKGALGVYLKNWETDFEIVKLFEALIDSINKSGAQVIIIHPPFQPIAYDYLENHKDFDGVLVAYNNIMDETVKKYEVSYCDVVNPQNVSCGPREYQDSSHTQKACSIKIFTQCLSQAPQWVRVLAPGLSK